MHLALALTMDFLVDIKLELLLPHLVDHVSHQSDFRELAFEDCMAVERMGMTSKAGLMEFDSAMQRLGFGV